MIPEKRILEDYRKKDVLPPDMLAHEKIENMLKMESSKETFGYTSQRSEIKLEEYRVRLRSRVKTI